MIHCSQIFYVFRQVVVIIVSMYNYLAWGSSRCSQYVMLISSRALDPSFHFLTYLQINFNLPSISSNSITLLTWFGLFGAVLRVCPCVTYEFKSVSYHLVAKNQTQNLTWIHSTKEPWVSTHDSAGWRRTW